MLAGLFSCVDVTPAYLWSNQLQVILLYPLADPEIFWPRNLCLSPWPNTTSSGRLTAFLTAGLAGRRPEQLFVSQAVLRLWIPRISIQIY